MNSTTMVRDLSKRNGSAPPIQRTNGSSRSVKAPQAPPDAGLIILDTLFHVIAADDHAVSIITTPAHPLNVHTSPKKMDAPLHLPQDILDVLRSRGVASVSGTKIPLRIGKQAYTCAFFCLRPQNGSRGEPALALYLQRELAITDAIEIVAKQYHLSDREQQALRGIASGFSAKEIAEEMNISPNTVKSFSRILMIKMGVGSRAGLVSKLLEYSTHPEY